MDIASELRADVISARDGDADAWGRIVDRFAGLIWSVARSDGLSTADAAEVSQTTWLRLAEHIGEVQDPERLGAWLVTTTRREAMRVGKVGARYVLTDPWQYLDMSSSEEVDVALLNSERDVALQQALGLLPIRCRRLLAALVAEEPPLSYAEVSAATGMPIGSVGPTRGRCLDRLRVLIEQVEAQPSSEPALVKGSPS
jgi:RNA polymerase sigma factor (sigma-70 family)